MRPTIQSANLCNLEKPISLQRYILTYANVIYEKSKLAKLHGYYVFIYVMC